MFMFMSEKVSSFFLPIFTLWLVSALSVDSLFWSLVFNLFLPSLVGLPLLLRFVDLTFFVAAAASELEANE